MVSFDSVFRACETGAGQVIRAFEIVRSWASEHRRDQPPPRNKLRRSISPIARPTYASPRIPPPIPTQIAVEPLINRKRKAPGSPSLMSRAKRQDNGYHKATSSPWANESWAQRQSFDLRTTHEAPPDRDARRMKCKEKRANRLPLRPRACIWNPFKYDRSPSPPTEPWAQAFKIRLGHHNCPAYPKSFHQDTYYHGLGSQAYKRFTTGRAMSEEEGAPLHTTIDENTLQATDFTPLRPRETEHLLPVHDEVESEPVENTEGDEEGDWDEEDRNAYRKLLRSQPESYDDDGFKVPIFDVISPETKTWNDNHKEKLLREAAQLQQTPSRSPKRRPSKTANDVPVENSTASSSPSNASRRGSRGRKSRSPPPAVDEREGDGQAITRALQPAETEASHTETVLAEPSLLIERLTLENIKPERTPKAGLYEETKRRQKQLASERRAAAEAAKDAYPLVPLSKAWNDKVRHAVNHGSDRFDATMFSRCVPEYSNDPRAGRSLWLDDAVINDYIKMVATHGSKGDLSNQNTPTVAALSSFFYTKIASKNPNYASCSGMVKRARLTGTKLLHCDKIFIPINQLSHWTLAVIEPNVPADTEASEPRRRITVYNSMGSYANQLVADNVLKWVQYELGADFKAEEWEINAHGESPQQTNSDDCGVFTCTTARQIMLGRYQDVNQRYKSSAVRDMRRRLVAELVNNGLLSKTESEE